MTTAAIIVLAYGPGQVTKDATERARRLAASADNAPVFLVPAIEPAVRFVRRAAGGSVHHVDGIGRTGLLEALSDVEPTGPVLVVHDDVLVTHETLQALEREHRSSGAVTIPYNNDRDSDVGVGPLPPVRQLRSGLTGVSAKAVRRPVTAFRPSCLLGAVGQLRALAPMRLTVARTRLKLLEVEVVAAEGAVVAHDSTCVDQLQSPARLGDRPLLTAAMIVRDEEDMLPDCLASLEDVVDRVIVCDTGSSDRTIELARAAGAEIIERPWRHDFAWARNEVLDVARDSWYVLQIDADERLHVEDPAEFRRLLATDLHDSLSFSIRIDNLDRHGRTAVSHHAPRLFRPDDLRYVGAIHEVPLTREGEIETTILTGVGLEHLGYADDVLAQRGKSERNIEIARQGYEEDPTAPTALHYARSLMMTGERPDLQRRLLEESLSLGLAPRGRAHALAQLASLEHLAGETERALELASAALDIVPREDIAAAVYARAAASQARWSDLVEMHERRRRRDSMEPYGSSVLARCEELLHVAQARMAMDDVPGASAAIEDVLQLRQPLDAGSWDLIVSVLTLDDPESALRRLVWPATQDPTGRSVEAVTRTHPAAAGADFALAVANQGTVTPTGVQAGLVAALIGGHEDLGIALAGYAGVLPSPVMTKLLETASARGLTGLAEALASSVLAGV